MCSISPLEQMPLEQTSEGNVKVRLFLILAALFCPCMSGCKTVRHMKDISQVSYTSESGTILPEEQWYEQIVTSLLPINPDRRMFADLDWWLHPSELEARDGRGKPGMGARPATFQTETG